VREGWGTHPGTDGRAGTPQGPTQPDNAAAAAAAATAQCSDHVQINIIDAASN